MQFFSVRLPEIKVFSSTKEQSLSRSNNESENKIEHLICKKLSKENLEAKSNTISFRILDNTLYAEGQAMLVTSNSSRLSFVS
jgi:hypothetical protein